MGCQEGTTRRHRLHCLDPILKDIPHASLGKCSPQRLDRLLQTLPMELLYYNRWSQVQSPHKMEQDLQYTCCAFAQWYALARRRRSAEHANQLQVNEDRHRHCWVNTDQQIRYLQARPAWAARIARLADVLSTWRPRIQRERKTRRFLLFLNRQSVLFRCKEQATTWLFSSKQY